MTEFFMGLAAGASVIAIVARIVITLPAKFAVMRAPREEAVALA